MDTCTWDTSTRSMKSGEYISNRLPYSEDAHVFNNGDKLLLDRNQAPSKDY